MDAFSIDQIIQPFKDVLQQEAIAIKSAAMYLFYSLSVIELAYTTLWMTLAGEGLNKMLNKLVVLAFTLGVFYECVQNGGYWVSHILEGFIEVGSDSGRINLNPVEIFNSGLALVQGVITGSHHWGILKAFVIAFVAAVLCLFFAGIYALIAAEVVIVLVKSYFLVALNSLFFAFAGNELTREMTVRYFQTVLGIGLQLMTLYFLIGIGEAMTDRWLIIVDTSMQQKQILPVLGILGGLIVYFVMVKTIPVFIASLAGVGRMQNYSGHAIASVAAAAFALHKLNGMGQGISPSKGMDKVASLMGPIESTKPISPKPPENKAPTVVPASPHRGQIKK